jgi:osmotically-inducible protein OsmY
MDMTPQHVQTAISPPFINETRKAAEVARAIQATGRFYSGQLDVWVLDGVVTLRGRVASYYQKQVAQTAALAVVGVGRLRNEVEVV